MLTKIEVPAWVPEAGVSLAAHGGQIVTPLPCEKVARVLLAGARLTKIALAPQQSAP